MNENIQRITANLPKKLLQDAQKVSGMGITETLIQGLEIIQRRRAYDYAMKLKGKLNLKIDLEKSRERSGD